MTQAAVKYQLFVKWESCKDNKWCTLNFVDLTHEAFDAAGVYIIWHGGESSRVVYVGQGDPIRDRLVDHRKDQRIQAYSNKTLYVTWAAVAKSKRDGVEVYLANKWKPLVGDRHPVAQPISVNSPWE